MKLYMVKLTLYSILCVVLLMVTGNSKLAFLSLTRNVATAMYLRHVTASPSEQVTWRKITDLFTLYVTHHPQDKIVASRLASALAASGDVQSAQNQMLGIMKLSNQKTICKIGDYDFLRAIARPPNRNSGKELTLAEQSAWRFVLHNEAVGTIAYNPTANDSTECVAWITVDFDISGNRYLELSQPVLLQPNTTYLLSALILVHNVQRVWLGIHSQWPGTMIKDVDHWQPVQFQFHTKNSPHEDVIHIVIDEGHGTVGIRQVKLEVVQ